jgi:hypothetical protein
MDWKKIADKEHINKDPLDIPNKVEYASTARYSELSDYTDLNHLFFVELFSSVVGHAKKSDEFHADHQFPFHNTVKNDKIQFDDPEAEDPVWKVKQAYTLMIAAASESENGVKNPWKRCPSGGHHGHPDFRECMPINHFSQLLKSVSSCSTLLLVQEETLVCGEA